MKFSFLQSTTWEVDDKAISYDLLEVKSYINKHITGDFGSSIDIFLLGYEIYDFQGNIKPHPETENLRRWSHKQKSLLVVKQFDFNVLKVMSAKDQFSLLKRKILEAINDFEKFKRKPKDFNHSLFSEEIHKILNNYGSTKGWN